MVANRHKITNVPLFKKIWEKIFLGWDNHLISHFSLRSGQFRGKKSLGPLIKSLEMAQK